MTFLLEGARVHVHDQKGFKQFGGELEPGTLQKKVIRSEY
jgi:hypothetical protein